MATHLQACGAWMAAHLQTCGAWMVARFQACGAWIATVAGHLVGWQQSAVILMVVYLLANSGMQVWTKEVIRDHDMRPLILVFFRQVVSAAVLWPFTLIERHTRPALTWLIFAKIFGCSLLGIVVSQCLFITGLKYTSTVTASAISNVVPVITFLLGFLAGHETCTLTLHGVGKCMGTLVCVGGAVIISAYRGPLILDSSGVFGSWYKNGTNAEEGFLGILFVGISCFASAAWYTLLRNLRNTYDFPITTTCLSSSLSVLPLCIIALIFEHDMSVWAAMGAMDYGLAVYSGAIGTALCIILINVCVGLRGSHFVSTFSLLGLITVTILSWILIGEPIYLGSFVGSMVLLIGLALMMFSMHRERVLSERAEAAAREQV